LLTGKEEVNGVVLKLPAISEMKDLSAKIQQLDETNVRPSVTLPV
jgi:hypothetical protein